MTQAPVQFTAADVSTGDYDAAGLLPIDFSSGGLACTVRSRNSGASQSTIDDFLPCAALNEPAGATGAMGLASADLQNGRLPIGLTVTWTLPMGGAQTLDAGACEVLDHWMLE